MALEQKMSVRALENFINDQRKNPVRKDAEYETNLSRFENPEENEIAERISGALGLKTKLKITNKGGKLTLYCSTCEELEKLMQRLLALENLQITGTVHNEDNAIQNAATDLMTEERSDDGAHADIEVTHKLSEEKQRELGEFIE